MQVSAATREPSKLDNACRLLAIAADQPLKGPAASIDRASGGLITRIREQGDFTGQHSETLLLHGVDGVKAQRLMLVGTGDSAELDESRWAGVCDAAARAVMATGTAHLVTDMANTSTVEGRSVAWRAGVLAQSLLANRYRFTLHPRDKAAAMPALDRLTVLVPKAHLDEATVAVARGAATASGMSVARDLGNLAPNICTPNYLADAANAMAEQYDNLKCEVLDEPAMAELGMGALLAVSRGSRQPARLIAMEYQGRKRRGAPVVLVGKGVTFDTGGISIKGGEGMDEMKYDMCGAASVFGVIEACCRLQLDINVVGVVAAVENMPDGDAYRPGDVVTSMSGQSIEILNTDAEGRLVLCDALTWVERYKPSAVIDIATLTGACIVALGHVASAAMGNSNSLVKALVAAGERSCDLTWQLPMYKQYQSQLDSNFADMANIGGRPAGSITAACFLSRFAKNYDWAHLDIAGVAWKSGKEKGASGRPVPLLMHFLFDRVDA